MINQNKYTPEQIEVWKQNRKKTPEQILLSLDKEILQFTKQVGKWLWITFDTKPDTDTLEYISALGFKWNKKRKTWQHPCGTFYKGKLSPRDPRKKYGEKSVLELDL